MTATLGLAAIMLGTLAFLLGSRRGAANRILASTGLLGGAAGFWLSGAAQATLRGLAQLVGG